ncbi:hypothetical protein Tmath_1983 [Thermoanaerobacter mathranii subsp. mathranii str. A3]|uniref:Uncharacterized protein n=1 Tax=Thermoanaerobacter mathranii subsp. mathranii (strain DSM 11426 / CCUG 53645 / CIP 108742 / A3) TaxID=583358 RepID=A0ABN3Z911_THEM3|nr:hypothetical protein Tmath_1983 [Thermoanaerobacter mathranii subsp. mathranii str. A3]
MISIKLQVTSKEKQDPGRPVAMTGHGHGHTIIDK